MGMDAENTPKTLQEAIKHFADYSNCHNFMVEIRWSDGQIKCPACGSCRIRYIRTRCQWECREQHPKRRFSLKTGTIMEDSPLPLEKWLAAMWVEVNCKNSISSWELHRALGVTQKTAWFMLHRVRHALHVGSFDKKLCGVVEADETFIGGLATNMHKKQRAVKIVGTGSSTKTAVMGLLERHDGKKHSTVRAEVLANVQRSTLHAVIHKNVEPGSTIYTDAWKAYKQMDPAFSMISWITPKPMSKTKWFTRTGWKTSGHCSNAALRGRIFRSTRTIFSDTWTPKPTDLITEN
jgi:transposase-like protein